MIAVACSAPRAEKLHRQWLASRSISFRGYMIYGMDSPPDHEPTVAVCGSHAPPCRGGATAARLAMAPPLVGVARRRESGFARFARTSLLVSRGAEERLCRARRTSSPWGSGGRCWTGQVTTGDGLFGWWPPTAITSRNVNIYDGLIVMLYLFIMEVVSTVKHFVTSSQITSDGAKPLKIMTKLRGSSSNNEPIRHR
jgi:hypothetical protein